MAQARRDTVVQSATLLASRRLCAWGGREAIPIASSADQLRASAGLVRDGRFKAAARLARTPSLASPALTSLWRTEPPPFGPRWSGHALLQPKGQVRYLERQFTEALATQLGRRGRARAFVELLCGVGGRPDLADSVRSAARVQVQAEAPLTRASRHLQTEPGARGSARRMDLLFRWPVPEQPGEAILVVEAKFGARIGAGQLKAYGQEARALSRGSGLAPGLFLISGRPSDAQQLTPAWRYVHWLTLMRRWEIELAASGDDDRSFAELRAQVWNQLGYGGTTNDPDA